MKRAKFEALLESALSAEDGTLIATAMTLNAENRKVAELCLMLFGNRPRFRPLPIYDPLMVLACF